MIRRLTALQDRSRLASRILTYYVAVMAVAIIVQYVFLDPHENVFTLALGFDVCVRMGIGFVLYVFAQRLINAQEAARADSVLSLIHI